MLGALTLSAMAQSGAPTITTPPQSQTVNPGSSVTFTVVASDSTPLSYQWEFNGAAIAGATAASFTLNNVNSSQAGTYTVVVSDGAGSVNSAAILVVNTPPSITSQPLSQVVNPGANVTFVVQASGSPPLFYQWQLGGSDIPGAVGAVLTLTNVQSADNGNGYTALVSNMAGSIKSAVAFLTVRSPTGSTPPSITDQPQSQQVSSNASVMLCATAFGSNPLSYQWRLNGVALTDGGNLSGSAGGCLTITGAQVTNAGTYTLTVSNAIGAAATDPAVLLITQTGGEVDFSNFNFPGAFVFDVDGVTRLSGPGYVAQLYAGSTSNSLAAVGPAVPFLTGDLAGYWDVGPNEVRDIPSVAPGSTAFVQVRVWQSGTGLTFEQAAAAGGKTGASAVLSVIAGGNSAPPILPAALTGFQSFALQSPLAITAQPAAQAVSAGGTATFSVSAVGIGPIAYQWLFNGAPISGATNPTLTLAGVQPAQAGAYSVIVSNVTGSVTSASATLTLLVAPTITAGPNSQTALVGTNVTFSVTAAGPGTLSYQWTFGTNPIPGATNTTLVLTNVSAGMAGAYTVTVSNGAGSITSAPATLTVLAPPSIVTGPSSQTVVAGANVTFTVVAFGAGTLSYQWNFGASPIVGATTATLTLTNVQAAQAGTYTVTVSNASGSTTSSPAALAILAAPTIVTGPASQTVVAGTNVIFTVVAAGTAPLSYQWQINGAPIPGANSATLTLPNVQATQAGNYNVVVSNAAGRTFSAAATLTIGVPPTVSIGPVTQTVNAGTNVTFSVSAVGAAPLTYQWSFNGTNITGATDASLVLTNVQLAQAGSYSVTVTNAFGSATPGAATLTVLVPPTITTAPVAQTVVLGGNAVFSVVAIGTAPLSYQWQINGAPIPGETNTTLAVNNVQTLQAGNYNVVIRNPAGTTASGAVPLTIAVPPTLGSGPASQTVITGTNVVFMISATGTAPFSYQWQFNGAPMVAATNAALTLTNVQASQAGAYSVAVANVAGSVTSVVATLTVLVPPTITLGPTNQTVVAGANVGYTIVAAGTQPLSYQWTFTGTAIPGATNTSLTLSNVQSGQAGSYAVTVTNLAGLTTSPAATLTVLVPPAITSGPTNQSVVAGASATFQVTVIGTSPLGYQWQFNNGAIPGAINATLTLTNVQAAQVGNYRLAVTNAAGQALSSIATLSLAGPVRFASDAALAHGTFQVTVTGAAGVNLRVEVSTNLVNWQPLTTLTNFNGQAAVADPQAARYARRFYRAVVATPASAPLQFQTNSAYSGGAFQMTLTGSSGAGVRVDFSTNLLDWLPLATITNFTGQATVTDLQIGGQPRRFYRAVTP